jgi:epsilon-lactone hydrolase
MSTEQQLQLDAILRQGRLDTAGEVAPLRAAFDALMSQVPIPPDIQQTTTTIGGVGAVEVSINAIATTNVILYFHGGVYVIGTAAGWRWPPSSRCEPPAHRCRPAPC